MTVFAFINGLITINLFFYTFIFMVWSHASLMGDKGLFPFMDGQILVSPKGAFPHGQHRVVWNIFAEPSGNISLINLERQGGVLGTS